MNVETVQLEVGRVLMLCVRVKGSITDEQYSRWLERSEQMHIAAREKKQRLAVLYDLSNAPPLTAQQRRLQTEWNERLDAVVSEVTLAVAFVTRSAIMRGVMTAIFWFNPPKAPQRVFVDLVEAVDWMLEHCKKNGELISPDTQRLAYKRLLGI